jgi:N-formylglutamate amidohydrolase
MTGAAPEGEINQGAIPGSGEPAFTLQMGRGVPVLVCAPHAGRAYPSALLARMRAPRQTALRLEDRHADLLARGAAEATGAALALAHAPRALIDLNRAVEDMDWSMVVGGAPPGVRHSAANRRARSGLGLVPRRLPGIGELWRAQLDRDEIDARVAGVHAPYHAAVARALEAMRDRWGAALLVDIHSMPPLPARAVGMPAPEFVLGDRFGASCHRSLTAAGFAYLEAHGRPAAHNRPYAGGYVLDRHGAPARGVHAIQVEVCRSSYLDAAMEQPSPRAGGMVRALAGLVRALGEETAALGRAGRAPLAAE